MTLRKLFGVGALDARKFMDLVVEIGSSKGVLNNPEVDYDEMRIDENGRTMNLRNIYANFLRTRRRERLAFLENAVVGTASPPEVPERWEDVRPLLRPVVRHGSYLTLTELAMRARDPGASPTALARKEIAPGLFATLVVDLPHAMLLVTHEHLTDWGVELDTALEAALSNLRAESQEPFTPLAPGVWCAPWSDSYPAARLLLPEVLHRVCSDPFVCAPNRDTLLVADGPDRFDVLVAILTGIEEEGVPYPLTRRIYQLEHKVLRPCEPPAGAKAAPLYHQLVTDEDLASYTEEKELRAKLEPEAFYASLQVYEVDDGTLLSRAVWTEGVDPSYLPPAQAIVFVKLDAEHQATGTWEVPWEIVVNTPGLLTRTDAPLPRWRTGAFPSESWLADHATKPIPADQAAS